MIDEELPCGAVTCPMEEHRLPVEEGEKRSWDRLHTKVYELLPYDIKPYSLLPLIKANWCKGHVAKGVVGQPFDCEVDICQAVQVYLDKDQAVGALVAQLRKLLEKKEKKFYSNRPRMAAPF